jgi:uncharacterized protein YfaS (alpha-2-macroglobulin family)
MSYVQGTVVRVEIEVRDNETGELADAASLQLQVKRPSGLVTTYPSIQLQRDDEGKYHYDIDTDVEPGTWVYQWDTRGSTAVVQRDQFVVRPRIGTVSP